MPKRKYTSAVESNTQVEATPRRTSRKKSTTKSWDSYASIDASSPLTSPSPSPAKVETPRKRRKKTDGPVVYDIPPITDTKTTTFKGRLGYACLNTILRTADPPVFCSRTCRIATLKQNGLQHAKDLGMQNARDLKKMVEWNEENGIKFMRISSEMFPFASHKEWGYDLEYAQEVLKDAGDTAKRLGHRLTTHPGQFTQLASPKENVVEASVRELDYHCQMMRYMGLGKDSVIILHMGGVYGDKTSTIARFRENYTKLLTDEMKARLVLENDEICYNPDDLLPICEELDIPVVLDYHHNYINPSSLPLSELIPRINKTWVKKGIRVKQHLSEPRPGLWYNDWKVPVKVEDGGVGSQDPVADEDGTEAQVVVEKNSTEEEAAAPIKKVSVMELRAHADRCTSLPEEVVLMGMDGDEGGGDLMIEAKDKEQAVFQLYRIYNLKPVKHENLRPEKTPKSTTEGGAEGVSVGGATPKRKRAKKASAATPADSEEEVSPESPKKRGRERKKASDPEEPPRSLNTEKAAVSPRAKRRRTVRTGVEAEGEGTEKQMGSADLGYNQEDIPVPVDGSSLVLIAAEEHPEAVQAGIGGTGVRGGGRRKGKKAMAGV